MAKQISQEQQEILSQIVPIIAEKLGVDPAEVTMSASLKKDLGADSLDTVELFMEFEKAYNLSVPDDEQEIINTVGEVVGLIAKMTEASVARGAGNTDKPKTTTTGAKVLKDSGATKTQRGNPAPQPGTQKNTNKPVLSEHILMMTVKQALGLPLFHRPVYEVLDGTKGAKALNLPLGELLTLYLQNQQEPHK